MKKIDQIEGLTDEGSNTEYQKLVFDAAFKGIMEAVIHPETNQALLRNEDVIEALLNIQALVLHTSKEVSTPKKLRTTCEQFAKRLKTKTRM